MENPGSYFLTIGGTDFSINQAATLTGDWLTDLDGMASVTLQIDFRAGTGAEADVRAFLQTSIDDGNTVVDIACMLFTAGDRRVVTISTALATSEPVSATDASMTDDDSLPGILGNRLRLKVVSTGTWTNTYLGGRVVAR